MFVTKRTDLRKDSNCLLPFWKGVLLERVWPFPAPPLFSSPLLSAFCHQFSELCDVSTLFVKRFALQIVRTGPRIPLQRVGCPTFDLFSCLFFFPTVGIRHALALVKMHRSCLESMKTVTALQWKWKRFPYGLWVSFQSSELSWQPLAFFRFRLAKHEHP